VGTSPELPGMTLNCPKSGPETFQSLKMDLKIKQQPFNKL
jgi:hypothetical protein